MEVPNQLPLILSVVFTCLAERILFALTHSKPHCGPFVLQFLYSRLAVSWLFGLARQFMPRIILCQRPAGPPLEERAPCADQDGCPPMPSPGGALWDLLMAGDLVHGTPNFGTLVQAGSN